LSNSGFGKLVARLQFFFDPSGEGGSAAPGYSRAENQAFAEIVIVKFTVVV
jgi:hypothetical protein